jgi:rod shape determining protein RodA
MTNESRRARGHIDWILIFMVFAVSVFGVLAVSVATFSTDSDPDAPLLNQILGPYYSGRQALFLLISPLVVIGMTVIPFAFIKRRARLLYFTSILVLLIVTLTNRAEGVKAWVDMLWGYTIQPSEFAKIAFILVLAKSLTKSDLPMSSISEITRPAGLLLATAAAIIIQGEMGTIIVLVFIFGIMLYFAGVKMRLLIGFAIVGVILIAIIYFYTVASGTESYRVNRILAFFNRDMYSQNDAYQQLQSMTAIGSGGLNGVGMYVNGALYQLDYVPADWTDFIFASVGEAFGFKVCISLIIVYMLIIFRLLYLAHYTSDRFGQLIIIGIMAMILYHIFQNIGMTIGVMPITGVPLPFISYGGSNMVSNMACIGIVINITKNRSLSASFSKHVKTPQISLKGRYFGET